MARRSVDLRTCFVAPYLKITLVLLHQIMRECLEANAAFVENLNRAQLFAGKNSDGTDITPDYTEVTVFIKQDEGQVSDHVTLHNTGAFYESIFLDVFDDAFQLEADDPKAPELEKKYGEKIYGLTDESKGKLLAHIKPQFIAKLKAAIK